MTCLYFILLDSVYRKYLCNLTSDIICLTLKESNNILSYFGYGTTINRLDPCLAEFCHFLEQCFYMKRLCYFFQHHPNFYMCKQWGDNWKWFFDRWRTIENSHATCSQVTIFLKLRYFDFLAAYKGHYCPTGLHPRHSYDAVVWHLELKRFKLNCH